MFLDDCAVVKVELTVSFHNYNFWPWPFSLFFGVCALVGQAFLHSYTKIYSIIIPNLLQHPYVQNKMQMLILSAELFGHKTWKLFVSMHFSLGLYYNFYGRNCRHIIINLFFAIAIDLQPTLIIASKAEAYQSSTTDAYRRLWFSY